MANGGTAGAAGLGGAGVSGQNINVINNNTISGGLNGGTTTRADAIDFTGGTNSLTPGAGTLNGGIGITGTLRVLGANTTLANPIRDSAAGAGSLIKDDGGSLTLTGTNTYTGGTTIGANGSAVSSTLQLGASTSAGTGTITFGSMSGTATARLGLNVAAQPTNGTFGNTIANFGSGNELALAGLTSSSVSYNSANSSITVTGTRTGGGQVSENFVLSTPRTTSFTATVDGQNNTIIRAATPTPAPCYVTGTRIRVLRGLAIQDVPVERLCVGDLALSASGKPRPIQWVGCRSYVGLTAPQHDRPVRIKAGALSDGMPTRDLLVSPDHALLIDGLFVAAGHLVNGTSITRSETVANLTYWHVELDSHDILLAEGAPAESFLAAPGVRGQFDGTGTDDAPLAPVAYAERIEHGPELAALRERLILRAGLSTAPMRFGTVRAWMDRCDGIRIAGWAQDAAHPNAPVCLDVVVDGVVVAMTLADQYRADIAAAGVGDGRHGFDLDLDEPLAPGMGHTVEIRRSADGVMVCAMAVDAAGAWMPLLAA